MIPVLIHVLLVDDDEDDYLLTRDMLAEIHTADFALQWARSYDEGLAALTRGGFHVGLLDYRLGARSGLELLQEATAGGCGAPLILLTGQGDHEVDVAAMKAGAADYLAKGEIDSRMLERSIRYALQRKRTEEAASLRQRAEALAEADRRKDEFLAILAHELRNPLSSFATSLELLKLRSSQDPSLRRTVDLLDRQSRKMARLIEDLLDLSRISQGKVELRKEPVELQSLLRATIEACQEGFDEREQRLSVELPGEPIWIEADATRVEQIVTNLLNNATKYTDPGGQVWLSADRQEDGAVIRVRDTGVGISAEDLPHVFSMYTQLDGARGRSHGGLGIGLNLVRQLVELHGGAVHVSSEGTARGSEFVVHLPLTASPVS